jgi:hypothetical protein
MGTPGDFNLFEPAGILIRHLTGLGPRHIIRKYLANMGRGLFRKDFPKPIGTNRRHQHKRDTFV